MYTGLSSPAHIPDRVLAPLMFLRAVWVFWKRAGVIWALSSSLAVMCFVLGKAASKREDYGGFIFWHTMWHVVGVGLVVWCFWSNGLIEQCSISGIDDEGYIAG